MGVKIYLELISDYINVILSDNTWVFYKGTIFVFESIGWSVEYIPSDWNRNSEYKKTECIRLNKVIYDKVINMNGDTISTTLEENIINPIFKKSYKNTSILDIMHDDEIFKDVSVVYNREEVIEELFKI